MSTEGSSGGIILYVSTISSSKNTGSQQNQIEHILNSKNIPYVKVDIASDPQHKEDMRRIMGNELGLAPQICNGENYCGDFEKLNIANDDGLEALYDFLMLPTPQKAE